MTSTFAEYIERRVALFERLYALAQKRMASMEHAPISIKHGKGVFEGLSHQTTPFEVSKAVNSRHKDLLVARVNGELYDVHRPIACDSTVEFLDFGSDEGRRVFWHSSAHILGEACEKHFSCHLCLGPPTETGFFYEMGMDRTVTPDDYPKLNKLSLEIAKEAQKFQRLEMSKEHLLEMFADNPLKVRLIEEKVADRSTVYRCGPLVDFCLGPHIPHTGYVKAIEVLSHSSCFFLGSKENESLQRVYGVSFPSKHEMREHQRLLEEAKKRNHRKIGAEQDLFFFSSTSPGSCFFLPKGAFIYNKLVELMREMYRRHGFKEVITPNVFNNSLWKKSGHWDNYKENMFCFEAEGEEFALKPMNCPSHCVMFGSSDRSYRELPLRFADFGVLHRNELSGTLTGLTRVRRFQQDDAHIFCARGQVEQEIKSCLGFLTEVYAIFDFAFSIVLSTRPEKFMGEVEQWDVAEEQLKKALDASGRAWATNEGDGAFYGPKIDISLRDAMGRRHQCGTIQLDFQLPLRFDLKYTDKSGEAQRPVMIHRAILGSVERMIAVLLESYGGRLPMWLNPNQVAIIPVSPDDHGYAKMVGDLYSCMEIEAFVDVGDNTLNKKILNAEKSRYGHIIIVGAKERRAGLVNIRKAVGEQNIVCGYKAAGAVFRRMIKDRRGDLGEYKGSLTGGSASVVSAGSIYMKALVKLVNNFARSAIKSLLDGVFGVFKGRVGTAGPVQIGVVNKG